MSDKPENEASATPGASGEGEPVAVPEGEVPVPGPAPEPPAGAPSVLAPAATPAAPAAPAAPAVDDNTTPPPGETPAEPPAEAPAPAEEPPRTGSYTIWIADASGDPILYEADGVTKLPYPKPRDPRAIDILFGVQGGTPAKDRVDLQDQIEKVLGTVRRIYVDGSDPKPERFRRWYIRLFQLAQLGLEGDAPPTAMAAAALLALTQELIDDEAPRVKNGHLRQLGGWVLKYSMWCLWAYVILRLLPDPLAAFLKSQLALDRTVAANFMLLWIGCFWGVWLSYGIRTVKFTLSDLTRTDEDLLLPQMRLLFIGSLTMLLGLLFAYDVVELKLGGFTAGDMVAQPVIAFLIGAFCGISEAALPGSIAGKASAFVGSIK